MDVLVRHQAYLPVYGIRLDDVIVRHQGESASFRNSTLMTDIGIFTFRRGPDGYSTLMGKP
jgi:hypothetical protein